MERPSGKYEFAIIEGSCNQETQSRFLIVSRNKKGYFVQLLEQAEFYSSVEWQIDPRSMKPAPSQIYQESGTLFTQNKDGVGRQFSVHGGKRAFKRGYWLEVHFDNTEEVRVCQFHKVIGKPEHRWFNEKAEHPKDADELLQKLKQDKSEYAFYAVGNLGHCPPCQAFEKLIQPYAIRGHVFAPGEQTPIATSFYASDYDALLDNRTPVNEYFRNLRVGFPQLHVLHRNPKDGKWYEVHIPDEDRESSSAPGSRLATFEWAEDKTASHLDEMLKKLVHDPRYKHETLVPGQEP